MKNVNIYEEKSRWKNDFPLRFLNHEKTFSLAPHWHERIELLFIVEGEGEFFCDGVKLNACENDLIVVNPAQIHSYNSKQGMHNYVLILSQHFFADIGVEGIMYKNHIKKDSFVAECFAALYESSKNNDQDAKMTMKSWAYALFAHLFRFYSYSSDTPLQAERQAEKFKRLEWVLAYIENNYSEDITTSFLANSCYLSESYFCRFFKKSMGMTVADYVVDFRIKKSQVLLKNTDITISAVAESVGFADANYFARLFKRVTGVTPTQYRRKYHHGE